MVKLLRISTLVFLLPTFAFAADIPVWKINPNESTLKFTANQNGADVVGSFEKFEGKIYFDPKKLEKSQIKIVVDIASTKTAYSDLTTTLLTPDWFDSAKYPKAIFQAGNFKKTGKNTFEAIGDLTIRNKTKKTTLKFSLEQYTDKSKAQGSTTIKRSEFGVGQGDWATPNGIKDDVKIDFTITATR